MWFGDLVTMTWWDDLWLKESFADFMGALASAEATRFTGAWVTFANRRKEWAYQQDQLPTTHPIVADVPDLEAAKLNFDGITYAKGASVLKQLVAFVGRDAFLAGVRRYFRTFEFANTTLDDLLTALSTESARDLTEWSRAWLESTGVSVLELEASRLEQTLPKPHRLAVGVYDADDAGALVRTDRVAVEITGPQTPVETPGGALVVVNDDDLTYAITRLDDRSLDTAEHSLARVADAMPRGLVWSSLWNATRDAVLPVPRYLAIVTAQAPGETHVGLLAGVLANAGFAIERYLPPSRRPAARTALLDLAWQALHDAEPGSGLQLTWARAVASAASRTDGRAADVRALLAGEATVPGLRLDPDLRWALWTALAATGNADLADLDGELARDDTGSGAVAHVRAAAARPDPEVAAAARHAIHDDRSLSNDRIGALVAGLRTGPAAPTPSRYVADYFASLRQVWAERSIEIARRIVVGLFPATDDTEAVDTWLADNGDAPGALRRLVVEQRDGLARALRVQAAGEPS